jgi:hypothetical protein
MQPLHDVHRAVPHRIDQVLSDEIAHRRFLYAAPFDGTLTPSFVDKRPSSHSSDQGGGGANRLTPA